MEARGAARARAGLGDGPAGWARVVRTGWVLGCSGRWGGALCRRLPAVLCWAAAAVAGVYGVRCARLLPRAVSCPGPLSRRARRLLRTLGRRLLRPVLPVRRGPARRPASRARGPWRARLPAPRGRRGWRAPLPAPRATRAGLTGAAAGAGPCREGVGHEIS
ncbi:hypothetical protein [Streptomyces palmae]|uniref:Uncharacterized protein n=1 Tax=Streptomyces palmae TaxID=1701085 RepID=A0A4Z0GIM2_9ACTN|nr:hypothetical protein [Streptomyces palmae]TGA96436.1 hypothetical protein E4099_24120 [Streptomyces palmae]